MSVDITTRINIERPVAEVAAFAIDPDRVPDWYVNIRSVEWQTEPPLQVGSKIAFVAQFLGRQLAYTYEVVDHEPNVRFVMQTAQGPFPMETSYVWESIGENLTRMRLRNRGRPSGFSRLLAPFMGAAIRRANTKDLALLKKILESPLS